MQGGCISGLCCFAFLLSVGIRASQDLIPSDSKGLETHEDNLTLSELASNEKTILLKQADEIFVSENHTESNVSARPLSQERSGYPEDTEVDESSSLILNDGGHLDNEEFSISRDHDKVIDTNDYVGNNNLASNGNDVSASEDEMIAKLYSDHNQYNPINAQLRAEYHKTPSGGFNTDRSPYTFHKIDENSQEYDGLSRAHLGNFKQNFISEGKINAAPRSASPAVAPYDVGNIQIPMFVSSNHPNEHQSNLEEAPIQAPYHTAVEFTGDDFQTNPTYDSLHTEALAQIFNSNLYPYNLGHRPFVHDLHPQMYQSHTKPNSEYTLSSSQIKALVHAIVEDNNALASQSSTSSSRPMHRYQHHLHDIQQYDIDDVRDANIGYTFPSQSDHFGKNVERNESMFYSHVVAQNEVIHLRKNSDAGNAITCSKVGEFYNLLTPSKQCLVCACLVEDGLLQPVCASCGSCARASEQRQKTPPPTEASSSCAPLPVGVTFEHPLNPCHICMCYILHHNKTHISCQEDPQCVKPPKVTSPPFIPDSPVPDTTSLCHKFPEDVEFPHPTENCRQCKCFKKDSSFGIQQYHMQCQTQPDCEATTPRVPASSPNVPFKNTFSPTLTPLKPVWPSVTPTKSTISDTPVSFIPSEPYTVTPGSDSIPPSLIHTSPTDFNPFGPGSLNKPTKPEISGVPVPTVTLINHEPLSRYPTPVGTSPGPWVSSLPPGLASPEHNKPPKPFIAIQPDRVVPFPVSSPGAVEPPTYPERPASPTSGQSVPSTVLPGRALTRPPFGAPTNANDNVDLLPWPPIISKPSQPGNRGPLLGPPPHKSCAPYPADAVFQHPWDECQVCRCAEYTSEGHISIEVNCYTKASCCVEIPNLHQSLSAQETEVIYIEPQCRVHPPGQPFAAGCSVCSCHAVYSYVIATCTPQPNCESSSSNLQRTGSENREQYARMPVELDSGRDSAGRHSAASQVILQHLQAAHQPWASLSPADIRAVADYMAIHKQKDFIQVPELLTNEQTDSTGPSNQYSYRTPAGSIRQYTDFEEGKTRTTNGQVFYSIPSLHRPKDGITQTFTGGGSVRYTATLQAQPSEQYSNGNYRSQYASYGTSSSARADSAPLSYVKSAATSRTFTSKSGEELDTSTSSELVMDAMEENTYPFAGPERALADISTTSAPSGSSVLEQQLLSGSRGVVTRAGRGRCQYVGDMYHLHCQPCYCFSDHGELYSLCTGVPCSS